MTHSHRWLTATFAAGALATGAGAFAADDANRATDRPGAGSRDAQHQSGSERRPDATNRKADRSGSLRERDMTLGTESAERTPLVAIRASKLKGTDVKNSQDKDLGDVSDLLVDLPNGRVGAVLVASGGILGIGEKQHLVPPASLTYVATDKQLILNVDEDQFKKGPVWDKKHPTQIEHVWSHYSQHPFWMSSDSTRAAVRERDSTTGSTGAANTPGWTANTSTGSSNGQWHRATELVGYDIYNASNQKIGDVEDLVIDLKTGHIVLVVVDPTGAGRPNVAVPPQAFAYGPRHNSFVMNRGADRLENAPAYKDDAETAGQLASDVYGYFNEPIFWTPTAPDRHSRDLNRTTDTGRQPVRQRENDTTRDVNR